MTSERNQSEENLISSSGSGPSTATLQQMLAISTSLTDEQNPNPTGPVDKDRMKFFFESLQSIQGSYQDDIEVIKHSLAELKSWSGDDTSLESCTLALQNIMDLVDHIDVASDFMKLDGFSVVSRFLRVTDPEVIRMSAEIIGISCQNHPQCQKAVVDHATIFPDLFSILQSSQLKDGVKLKAVFALSSSIQNNPAGHDKFKKLNGYDVFLNVLKTGDIPLRLRICFVFDCLCSQFPEIKSNLLEKHYVNSLVELLTLIPLEEPKETVLNAMLTFIEGFYDAICECKKVEHNLKPILEYLIRHYKDEVVVEKEKAIRLKEELDRFALEGETKSEK